MTKPTPENVIDMHRQVSIAYLKSTPAYAVRTPRGQKDPGTVAWDAKANDREKSNETLRVIERTNDNLGVHLFGSVVDVDVDTDNVFMTAALDAFLPPTPHVWGRKSRPRTHRLYQLGGENDKFDPKLFPFLTQIQKNPDIAVEVRGGEQKSANYSLLPGSMHPSGEAYEWHDLKSAQATPVFTDMFKLLEGVRMACVVALVAPHWTEGVRNELCKGLSGFMHKAAQFSEELNMDLPFGREMARRVLDTIISVTGDENDAQMRVKTFDQTWDKADQGTPVLGATHLTKITGDEELLRMLYVLLANTPDLAKLDEIFDRYAVIRNTTSVLDLDMGASGNYIMNKDAFTFTMAGNYIETQKGRLPTASVFLNSLRRSIVDHVGINPGEEKMYENARGQKVANLWTGWAIEPHPDTVDDEEVEVFTDYLLNTVCRGDHSEYNWLVMWLADIFQNPASKPGTAVVIVGMEGAGKSVLAEHVLRPIIGDAHFTKSSSVEKIVSKFNKHMAGKILIEGEEVMNTNRKSDADQLKDAITSKKRTVEPKGIDAYEMEDYARYIFVSNAIDNAVSVSATDRRYSFFHASDRHAHSSRHTTKAQKEAFFRRLYGWLEEDVPGREPRPRVENLSKLHRWFLQQRVDRDKIRGAIESDAKAATKQSSSRGIDKWLLSIIECTNPFEMMRENDRGVGHSFVCVEKAYKTKYEATDGWPTHTVYTKLEQLYRQMSVRDKADVKTAQQLAKFFKDTGMLADTEAVQVRFSGQRVKVRPFPSREAIRGYLEAMGYEVLTDAEEATTDEEDDNAPSF